MSVYLRRESRQIAASKWGTIRYAIGSTARTIRLCTIILVTSIPPGLVALIIHH